MNNPEPDKLLIIQDLQTLRIIAEPLHIKIYEVLAKEPLTIKQAGERLGVQPSKLYYHFNLLEKHGFIRVVETRTLANLIEKRYWITARELGVDAALLSSSTDEGKEVVRAVLSSTIDAARDDLVRALGAHQISHETGHKVIIQRAFANIPEHQAEEFQDRLLALIKDFSDAGQKSKQEARKGTPYGLLVAIYPNPTYPDHPENTGEQPLEASEPQV